MADIPGAPVSHAIITPTCVVNRSVDGAWDEAVRRAHVEYLAIIEGWSGREAQPTMHLVLTMERPSPAASAEGSDRG